MPALVNIKVGSLRGTSGDDDTISWPLSAKNLRKVDLISLTPLIKRPIAKLPEGVAETLLDKGPTAVQKLATASEGCSYCLLFVAASGVDLTFVTRLATNSESECQIRNSTGNLYLLVVL